MPARTVRWITLSQAIALAALVLVGAMALQGTQRFVRDARLVNHSHEVRSALRELTEHLDDAKADVRSFLVTGDSGYVRHAAAAVDSARRTGVRLDSLTVDNADQGHQLALLHPLIELRRQKLLETVGLGVAVARSQLQEHAARLLREGEQLSRQIAGVIDAMDRTEASLQAARARAQEQSRLLLVATIIVLLLLALGLSLLTRRIVVRDLEQRTRIEGQLRASEARFSGVLAIAADAIVSIDAGGTIVSFNHAAETVFGYQTSDAIGKPLDMLLPQRYAAAHRAHVAGFASSSDVSRRMGERREVAGRRRDGTEFPADVSISKLATPDGLLFTAVVRDVTVQRRLEHHEHTLAVAGARLTRTLDYEDMLRLVVDLPVHAIGDWSLLDVIESQGAGPGALRRVVSSHADAARHAALQSMAGRGLDWDSPSEAIDVIRTGQPRLRASDLADSLEAHAGSADELRDLQVLGAGSYLCVPLIVRDRVIGALTIGRHEPTLTAADLALAQAIAEPGALAIDNARLYGQAQRALAARDEVLAIVSHDLRTPASAITMCAKTLIHHPPASPEDRRALYQTILESADWMHRLMQDLLDAASIDAGRLAVHLESQAVAPMVQAAAAAMMERAREASVTLSVDVEDELPSVLADRERILQLLGNLLGNAVRFTPKGGTIELLARRDDDGVRITVRDSGTGIEPEHLPHIFDRFWQVSRAGIAKGSGLGLAIAKGIVDAHRGTIGVDSTPGAGSTFHLVLPSFPR